MSKAKTLFQTDTTRLDWLLVHLGFNDTEPDPLPCRDWRGLADARAAIDEAMETMQSRKAPGPKRLSETEQLRAIGLSDNSC